jgi:hypothetical protein
MITQNDVVLSVIDVLVRHTREANELHRRHTREVKELLRQVQQQPPPDGAEKEP